MSKAGVNRVLFRIFDRVNDGIVVNGKRVFLDTRVDYNRHVNVRGKVIQIPLRLNKQPLTEQKEHFGKPQYVCMDNGKGQPHPFYSNKIPEFHTYSDISQDVQVGDDIYYYYTTILDEAHNFVSAGHKNEWGAYIKHTGVRENGIVDNYEIWSVRYDRIICAVRGEEIIMIGDHVLVSPDMECEDDILHPVYYDINLTNGVKVLKPKSEWLLIKPNVAPKHRIGYVVAVGNPLKDTITDFEVGDRIIYHKNADFPIEIRGKQYYAMRKSHILAKVETNDPILVK